MKSIVIQAWVLLKYNDEYYLPYTHWIYLQEISKYYSSITIVAPVKLSSNADDHFKYKLASEWNINVVPLPYSNSYGTSIRYFREYVRAYKKLKSFDVCYTRYPSPFGWLQYFLVKSSKKIVHYVGDPIQAAVSNQNFSIIKKVSLAFFFLPEHFLFLWASKFSVVYTNGHHISKKLKRIGINAKPLISSTLQVSDFYSNQNKIIKSLAPKLLYVGYIRKAKGIETIIDSFEILKEKYPHISLTIVGTGDFESALLDIIKNRDLKDITFLGHIDSREELNKIFRQHDIFTFASVSEGSPRVILEAMANSINIVSTPVGSLPSTFVDERDILFADFNDPNDFSKKIMKIIEDKTLASSLRYNAYNAAEKFTINSFIREIFYEN